MTGRSDPAPTTQSLAEFVAGIRYDSLPAAVTAKARGCVLDFLGAAVAGSRREHCRAAVGLVSSFGGVPEATVLGQGRSTSAPWAAYLNGVFGSSTPQQDDVWKESLGHPGVGTLPAAFALGERSGASGRRLLQAVVAGYEVAMRIGSAVGKESLNRGWHPRGGVNYFAAATAGTSALGIQDPDVHLRALSLAGNTAAGLTGASYYYDAWYTLSGNASLNGVLAALHAQAGYSSGPEILEAAHGGYLRVVVDEADWDALVRGLGEEWQILRIGQKVHASSGATHAAIDATLQIVQEHDIRPDDIRQVRIRGFRSMVGRTGRPFPQNLVHAGMSVPFLVAAAIRDRKVGLDQTGPEARQDPVLRSLQERMELAEDPELEDLAPRYLGAAVEIDTTDGRTASARVLVPKGDAENPLSPAELEAKFHDLAGPVLGAEQAMAVVEAVRRLDELDDLEPLLAPLRIA